MFFKKKVENWLKQGLITPEQAKTILNKESSSSQTNNKSWMLYGFLIVAVFSAGLGIISLIASNWIFIPDTFKLTIYFSLLLALALIIFKLKKYPLWFEASLILFMFACLGGIGLIAQIYNLKGDGWKAFLLWSLITFGLMLFSQKAMTTGIWILGFTLSFLSWANSLDYSLSNLIASHFLYVLFFLFYFFCYKSNLFSQTKALKWWCLIMGLIASIHLTMSQFTLSYTVDTYHINKQLIYLFFVLLLHIMTWAVMQIHQAKTALYLWLIVIFINTLIWIDFFAQDIVKVIGMNLNDSIVIAFLFMYFLFFVLLSFYCYMPKDYLPSFIKKHAGILTNWAVALGAVNLLFFNITHSTQNNFYLFYSFPIGLLLYATGNALKKSQLGKIQKIILSVLLSLLSLFFILVFYLPDKENLIKLSLTVLILISSGIFAISVKNNLLFVLSIIFLILRIFIFYLEKLYNFNLMGLGLIISAIILAGFIVLVQKNKDKIDHWVKQLE